MRRKGTRTANILLLTLTALTVLPAVFAFPCSVRARAPEDRIDSPERRVKPTLEYRKDDLEAREGSEQARRKAAEARE